ncbi:hypothetical protein DM828_28060 [Pseudomonas umsongensis]|nr:hypothetical protein [Pseudomonas umsongensis]
MLVPVGASTLAMVVNDNAGNLMLRGVLRFFASMLAPTESGGVQKSFSGSSFSAASCSRNANTWSPQ